MDRATTTRRWRPLRRFVAVLALLSLPAAVGSVALPGIAHARGDRLYVVMSGSMSPALEAGDAVLVRPVQPEQLRPGMVITYRAGGTGAVTTHRIVSLPTVDGSRYVQTKGDANAHPDPDFTPVDSVLASLDERWEGIGPWVAFTQSRQGRLLLLGPALVLLSVSQLLSYARVPARPSSKPPVRWRHGAGRTARRMRIGLRGRRQALAHVCAQVSQGVGARLVAALEPARARRSRSSLPAGASRWRSGPVATGALALVVLCALTLAGPSVTGTRAAFAYVVSLPGNAVGSGSVAPATGLAAGVSGMTVTLTWTATTTTTATGYHVLRSTVSGGPYTQIAAVTGRTTTSYADNTASGTVFYVLRSVLQDWTSANSNQASATTTGKTTTAMTSCTSQVADTGGNGNGYELAPMNACVKDALVAQDTKSGTSRVISCTDAGKDRHRFSDYSLPVPSTSTVNGIEVQLDAFASTGNGIAQICVQLSGDAGATWTTVPRTTPNLGTAPGTYLLGGTGDLWGTAWTPTQLNNANFRVRVIDVADTATKGFSLDHVGVRVTYTP